MSKRAKKRGATPYATASNRSCPLQTITIGGREEIRSSFYCQTIIKQSSTMPDLDLF